MGELNQEDLNVLMHKRGQEKYQRMRQQAQKEGEESRTSVGQQLTRHCVEPFSEAILDWRYNLGRYQQGDRKVRLAEMYDEFPEGMIPEFVIKTIINYLYKEQNQQSVSYQISKRLLEERRELEFKKLMPQEYRNTKARTNRRRRMSDWKRAEISKKAKELDATLTQDWTKKEMMDFGIHMLTLAAKHTGLIELKKYRPLFGRKPKTKFGRYVMVVPTEMAIDWLERGHEEMALRRPDYLPMIDKPWEWVDQFDGGYPDGVWRRWPLVKQRKPHQHNYSAEAIPDHYESVNHMQNTGWRVNSKVLSIADHFWKQGGGIAGLPMLEDKEVPEKPHDHRTNEEARKAWARKAAIAHQWNNANRNRRLLTANIIDQAKMFEGQALHFPWCMDFRGRTYPVGASFLHPQGCKLARGLLVFDEGMAIPDKDQVRWFMIHGANCWGLDKQNFEDRLHWVQEAHKELLAVAENPFEHKLWMDADDPWGFLAWCFEYAEWMKDPEGFKSSIAVGQDHTNSGLQLYSLLLRDRRGAEATNCTPTDKPNDSYQMVADMVTTALEGIAAKETHRHRELARIWLEITDGRLPRSVTKRNVMTIPYGAKPYSQREYLEEWVRDFVAKSPHAKDRWLLDHIWDFTVFLVPLITEAVRQVCPSPLIAMDFIRRMAKLMVDNGIQPTWKTPMGFQVVQECKKNIPYRLDPLIGVGGSTKKLRFQVQTDQLDSLDAQDGMPPNFVHSLDATLMHRITLRLKAAGVDHMAMIHDDYRVHAANSPFLAQVTREVLVETFTPDLMKDLRDQVVAILPEETDVPALPEYGDLDISEVLDADYILS